MTAASIVILVSTEFAINLLCESSYLMSKIELEGGS